MEGATVDVRSAMEHADLRVLLMVLFHLSGDRRWLEPPFRPRRDVQLIADENAGLEPAVREAVRAAAVARLSEGAASAVIGDPGDELMVEMMSACLGEPVAPEYAPMMREEMGFCPRHATWGDDGPPRARLEALDVPAVAIVGAGASGLALGANLESLGIPYVVLEKNDTVGGTWHVNRYPGCGVDTPNHAYSFSFGERYPWARYFATRDQLHDYLERSADAFGVRPHVRFGTEVKCATWIEARSRWRLTVETVDGRETLETMALVSAIGQLSLPSYPEIEGLDAFAGPIFHSSAWPADLDLTGKRVAVVGTGASSMQIVPAIVDEVARLDVYQRTAQWVRPIPRYDEPIGSEGQWLLRHVPYYAEWFRFTMLWRYGDGLLPTLRKDPDWPHADRSLNRTNDRHRREMVEHIERSLAGRTDLVAECTPSYPPFGKRILLDNGWYDALNRPNVTLVTEPITRFEPAGIVAGDGSHRPADVVVLATGFSVGQLAARLNLTGRGGRALSDVWKDDDPRAYLGITVSGFPNLFILQGPNTGLGHGGSAIFQSECQSRYIAGCLTRMLVHGIDSMEPGREAQDAYIARVDEEHERLIWTHPGMTTYYRNARGRVVSVMPWRLVDYWAMTREPDLDHYHLTRSKHRVTDAASEAGAREVR